MACSRKAPQARRIAFLQFDDQTGEKDQGWISQAAPSIVAAELATTPSRGVYAPEMRDAVAARATHAVHGYYDKRGGRLHFEISLEDLSTHRSTVLTADGDLPVAATRLALAIDATASPFGTTSPDAVAAWGKGEFQKAIELDSGFGGAWLSWARASQPAEATAIAERALANKGLRSDVDRARLTLLLATLRQDAPMRSRALADLVKLVPPDAATSTAAAESEFTLRRFAEAAELFAQAAKLDPDNANLLNLQGYAYAFAGNLEAARKAFEEYAARPGQEANALDSLGEEIGRAHV